jgi:hypothetical protein
LIQPSGVKIASDGICAPHSVGVINPASIMSTKPLFAGAATAAAISVEER